MPSANITAPSVPDRPRRRPERRPAHRLRGHGRPALHADQVRRGRGLEHRHRPGGRRAERRRRRGHGGRRHAAGRERRRLGAAVAGPDRRRRQPDGRHRRQRVGVLSVVEHARRPAVERLPRRPVVQRLRRPHLLGRRDVDVPDAARPAPRPGRADGRLPLRAPRRPPGSTPSATGSSGARFPWESALDGTEQIPPPVSVNSEGLYEQHITADIALAQWQYYVTTGNAQWLRTRGWPVIQGAAQFWASRAVRGAARPLPHRSRHRTRRGEPQRQRRGVHQRRRAADPADRDQRRPA